MTMEELLNGRRGAGRIVTSPTNKKYIQLCRQEGKQETQQIMKDYAKALKEAGNIYIG
jgi:aspartate/glutamate racemase